MSEALQEQPETVPPQVHSQEGRYDGSRTPPEVRYEIMRRHQMQLPISAIADEVHCDPRTVKAVIENWGNAPHKLKLQAYAPQLVDEYILSWEEARKRGKSDSLLTGLHALGITEPPRTGGGSQVAVQINLNGGPEPQSLVVEAQARELPQETGLDSAGSDNAGYVSETTVPQPVAAEEFSVTQSPVSKPAKRTRKGGK